MIDIETSDQRQDAARDFTIAVKTFTETKENQLLNTFF